MEEITKFDDIPLEAIVTVECGDRYICGFDRFSKTNVLIPISFSSKINPNCLITHHDCNNFPKNAHYNQYDIIQINYNGEIIFKYNENRELSGREITELITRIVNFDYGYKYVKYFIDDVEYWHGIRGYNGFGNSPRDNVLIANLNSIKIVASAKKIEVEE